jgi:fibronectin-binding autotransporter adhesin
MLNAAPGANLINNTGTVVLNAANTYGGGTTLNGGVAVTLGNNASLGTGALNFNGGTIQPDASGLASLLPVRTLSNAITFAGTQPVAMVAPGGALTTINGAYAADAFFGQGGNTDLRLTGAVALGANIERTLNVVSANRVVTLSGAVTGTGSAGLIAAGGGFLRLSNPANSYSGNTAVATNTTLVIGAAGALPAASTLVGAGGNVGFWDVSTTFNNNVNLVGNLGFDIGPGQTVTQGAGSVISNTGILTKLGLGTLVLGGSNTFGQTGQAALANQIALNAGVLSISSDANLGNPNPVVAVGAIIQPGGITFGGGQLLVTETMSTIRALTMTGVGSIVVAPGKTLTLNGANGGTALLTIAGGTVVINQSSGKWRHRGR